MTSTSSLFLERELKLQAVYAFWFIVHILQIIHTTFPNVWEFERLQRAKMIFKVMVPHDRPHTISCQSFVASLSCTISEILITYFPKIKQVMIDYPLLGVICHV